MNVNKTQINTMAAQATTMSVEMLESNITDYLQSINKDATEVLNSLRIFKANYEVYKDLKSQKKKYKKTKDANLEKVRQELREYEKTIYDSFFAFQNKFNNYFNRQIQMAFLYRDEDRGTFTIYTGNNDMSHVDYNMYGHLSYNLNNIQHELALQHEDYNSTLLDDTANEVYFRFEKGKSAVNNRNRRVPILWKNADGKYSGAYVNNKGTIAEAYVNFYLNAIPFVGTKEIRVGSYVMDEEYGIASVDNTLGFWKGDVDRGNIQYAVKSNYAGLMGMHKVYTFIKDFEDDLKNMSNEAYLEHLAQKFVNDTLTPKVKQIQNIVSDEIEKTLGNLFDSYLG